MPTPRATTSQLRTFDARPDRIDLRDREYAPKLVRLPASFPVTGPASSTIERWCSSRSTLVQDQGNEGACTGFGLAALVNHLLHPVGSAAKPNLVSPAMLYALAQRYDEWPGEDYDGSSCRGAMKGWHKHGICLAQLWPYGSGSANRPKPGWQADAALRPLGAYYRVNKDSIADLQSAIFETGAVYVSAAVHEGWTSRATTTLPTIRPSPKTTGGHAFAIVGYDDEGFLVQNSWGRRWGYQGFARLTYADWVANGYDAWVAVLGVPMRSAVASRTVSLGGGSPTVSPMATNMPPEGKRAPAADGVECWSEAEAVEHTIVLGNNGQPQNRFVDLPNGAAAVAEVLRAVRTACDGRSAAPRMVIYAHGGLNSEAAAVRRARRLGPWFAANGIHPVFVGWRTGLWETLTGLLRDAATDAVHGLPSETALGGRVADALRERRDRTLELLSRHMGVRALWSEMKQNAEAAAAPGGGMHLVARELKRLADLVPGLEIHMVGHSAGSLVQGHLLTNLARLGVPVASCHLYAAACTLEFANRHYLPRLRDGTLSPSSFRNHVLSDAHERADRVGPYGKSLLYLISRSLEPDHRTPLLGMATAWATPVAHDSDLWNPAHRKALDTWNAFADARKGLRVVTAAQVPMAAKPPETVPAAHGSFDNNLDVLNATLTAILHHPPRVRVTDLRGF